MAFEATITKSEAPPEESKSWTADFAAFAAPEPSEAPKAKDVAETADNKAKEASGAPSSVESAAKALQELAKSADKKMTPDLKDRFEGAIKEADAGKKAAEYKKEADAVQKKIEDLMTDEKAKEITSLQQDCNTAWGNLTPKQKESVRGILDARNNAKTPAEHDKADAELKKEAKDLHAAINKLEAAARPIMVEQQKLEELQGKLAGEHAAKAITRMIYAVALLNTGDKPGALKQFEDAATKDPAVLDNPQIQKLIELSGGDVKKLKEKVKPAEKK